MGVECYLFQDLEQAFSFYIDANFALMLLLEVILELLG